jgi:predicted transcriptional regulator
MYLLNETKIQISNHKTDLKVKGKLVYLTSRKVSVIGDVVVSKVTNITVNFNSTEVEYHMYKSSEDCK